MMEMRLQENPEMFSTALLQLGMRYLFVYGVQVFYILYSAQKSLYCNSATLLCGKTKLAIMSLHWIKLHIVSDCRHDTL